APDLAARPAFARQKVDEVVALGRALTEVDAVPAPPGIAAPQVNADVRAWLDALGSDPVRTLYAIRQAGRITTEKYEAAMRAEIDRVIALQEDIGLDVLVRAEPERNDMVQYFAEHLDGFAVTENGWVQSYGSRCVRPPILHG